ncbi:MAG: hypothetical protein BGO16_11620 [Nitrobacter sp. 62-23]|nr:MAG: hypothetical protein BGO16_11620 [Nitrobacter sp. 62-23]
MMRMSVIDTQGRSETFGSRYNLATIMSIPRREGRKIGPIGAMLYGNSTGLCEISANAGEPAASLGAEGQT